MEVTSIITRRWLTTVVNWRIGLSPVVSEVGRWRFSPIFGSRRGIPSVVGGRITSIILGFSPVVTSLGMGRFELSSVVLGRRGELLTTTVVGWRWRKPGISGSGTRINVFISFSSAGR